MRALLRAARRNRIFLAVTAALLTGFAAAGVWLPWQPHVIGLFQAAELAVAGTVIAFLVIYSYLAPWWHDRIGQTIAWKDMALLLAITPGILSLFFHLNRINAQIATWFDLGCFMLIAAIMAWRSVVFLQEARAQRNSGAVLEHPETGPGAGPRDGWGALPADKPE